MAINIIALGRSLPFILGISLLIHFELLSQEKLELEIRGTEFYVKNEPFRYNGISFFNAIYNPNFNQSDSARNLWLEKLNYYGINVIRVWAQWDNKRGFVDACNSCTMFSLDGDIDKNHLSTLKNILKSANNHNMIVEFVFFSRESWNQGIVLSKEAYIKAAKILTRELMDYRNMTFQIWNENSLHIRDLYSAIKSIDPVRLVTNSPGYAGDLGDEEQNKLLDFLTPHTSRSGKHWELAGDEIQQLIKIYKKPVVDDEPARRGTKKYGGPKGDVYPSDFILHINNVWKVGSYAIYHHDMFQTGYGSKAVSPSGIPDPEFSSFHQQILEFLSLDNRYH